MTLNTFDVGDTVRLAATYTDTGGGPIDPTSVKFVYRHPTGTESTVTSLSTSVVNPSSGSYYTDILINSAGTWRWRSYSTGSLNTAAEAVFVVRKQWVST